jgi:hypothetical protein
MGRSPDIARFGSRVAGGHTPGQAKAKRQVADAAVEHPATAVVSASERGDWLHHLAAMRPKEFRWASITFCC